MDLQSEKQALLSCLMLGAAGIANAAEHPWSLTVDALVDSADARSLYTSADVQLTARDRLYSSGGLGRIDTTFETLDTRAATLGYTRKIGMQGEIGAVYDYWSDSAGMDSHALEMPLRFGTAGLRIGFTPGFRRLTTDVLDPQTGRPREETFEDWQLGVGVSYIPGDWRFYGSVVTHRIEPDTRPYRDAAIGQALRRLQGLALVGDLLRQGDIARVRLFLDQQQLAALRQLLDRHGPQGFAALLRYQARRVNYLTSVQTLAQGLKDDEWTLEIARAFGLRELSFEHGEAQFVLDGVKSRTDTLRFLTPLGERWDLLLQGGRTRAEAYEDLTFYGVAFTRYFQ